MHKNQPKNVHLRGKYSMQEYLLQEQDPILLPRRKEIRAPLSPDETRQSILNCLACTVPHEGRMRVFRNWVPVIFVLYIYKGGELTAVVRTRSSDGFPAQYHIASHLLQNCIHSGKFIPDLVAGARESVWKSLQIFLTRGDVLLNRGLLLTQIPTLIRSVAPGSQSSFLTAQTFINEFFTGAGFLFSITFKHALPFIFDSLCSEATEFGVIFTGRRRYKADSCPGKCPCRWDRCRLQKPLEPSLLHHLIPSTVNEVLQRVWMDLENHIRIFPGDLFVEEALI